MGGPCCHRVRVTAGEKANSTSQGWPHKVIHVVTNCDFVTNIEKYIEKSR